jgi:hypothetical protein
MTTVEGLKQRQQDLQAQSIRLVDAIAQTGEMEVLVAKLKAIEAERKAVDNQITAHRPVEFNVTDQQVRQHVTKGIRPVKPS